MKQRPFLTAYWHNLLNLTYQVPPELLLPLLPNGLTLDVQNGKAFASLVAFDFRDTKVRGLKIPFHVNFPEINLRYYVKHGDKRAVCFVTEFVPKFCIAFVADRLYNEPYQSLNMRSETYTESGRINIAHYFTKEGKTYFIKATALNTPQQAAENSPEHYFKEHDTGFGSDKRGRTLSYKVLHPIWRTYPLEKHEIQVDFGHLYGPQWAFLNHEQPFSALLAEGSAIEVYSPYIMK